jgi:lipoprotein-releasing system permease protein
VVEKRKELSILRAVGALPRDLRRIVWVQGAVIGGVGITGGLILGGTIAELLKRYEFIKLPDVYLDRTLPVVIDPVLWVVIAGAAAIIVFLAALIPAQRAIGITPMDGITERK